MPKRIIEAGHLLSVIFVALLLLGARGFLLQHPILAGALLIAFAPAYYFAARITDHRQFLYPAVLLPVVAYHLWLYGAGLPAQSQPLLAVLPLVAIYLMVRAAVPRGIAGSARTLTGSAYLIIAAFSLWILYRGAWLRDTAAVVATLALALYGTYFLLRYLQTQLPAHSTVAVLLFTAGYLFLLYAHAREALGVGLFVTFAAAALLQREKLLPIPEAAALGVGLVYLAFRAVTAEMPAVLAFGYLAASAAWMYSALLLQQRGTRASVGPHPAPMVGLVPLFGAAVVLALVPFYLAYPWDSPLLAGAYLALLFGAFFAAGRQLARQGLTLIGVGWTRVLSGVARLAPIVLLAYLAAHRFPPSYRLGVAALAIAAISALGGWRQLPRMLTRRDVYAYQSAAFLALAYFLAERRLAPAGALAWILDCGALIVIALLAGGYLLKSMARPSYAQSLLDAASVPAAIGCVLLALRNPADLTTAFVSGGILVAVCVAALWKARTPATLFTLPVVLGYWTYVVAWSIGVRGESLGLPYLVYGFASAAIGYTLLRRGSRWYELFYFMWFLCTGVSLVLFYPYSWIGAYAAPLWPIPFLLVAYGSASRKDFPFALALEIVSGVLAAASVAVLVWKTSYSVAALAFLFYAVLYARTAVRQKLWAYLYPSAFCAVGASFLAVYAYAGARFFLPYFWPVAAVFFGLGTGLRRKSLRQQAFPYELAASAGAVAGTALFLAFPFAVHLGLGTITGLGYLVLFALLTRVAAERAYLSGVGLAAAFSIYQMLPAWTAVTRENRLGVFIPVALMLAVAGYLLRQKDDQRGAWSLYSSAIAIAGAASFVALWERAASFGTSRVVLIVAMAVWLALLLWTRLEVFIYCSTLGLAMLVFNFVQTSANVFGQHLVVFFLAGTIVLGAVFLAAAVRHWMRFREPSLVATPAHWYRRLVYVTPVALLGLATFGSWGVSTSSNPNFCGTCHDMKGYYANWKNSAHARANVACSACHYDPGLRGYMRAKIKGTAELVTTLTATQGYKPIAHVNNVNCLTSGCHSLKKLQQPIRVAGTYTFSHGTHLGPLARGPELRCTSCHSDTGTATHFALDTNTCITCHFKAASPPHPIGKATCVTCHGLATGAFDHQAAGVTADDASCVTCHQNVAAGSARVEERSCRHCHEQPSAELMRTAAADIHKAHVTNQGIGCDWCHGVIRHGSLDTEVAKE